MEMAVSKVVDREGRLPREAVLRDFVRHSQRVTSGLAMAPESHGRELVDRMVHAGRVTPEEGERLRLTLLARVEQSRRVFEGRVEESVRRAVERINEISSREISRLAGKLSELDGRIEKLAAKR